MSCFIELVCTSQEHGKTLCLKCNLAVPKTENGPKQKPRKNIKRFLSICTDVRKALSPSLIKQIYSEEIAVGKSTKYIQLTICNIEVCKICSLIMLQRKAEYNSSFCVTKEISGDLCEVMMKRSGCVVCFPQFYCWSEKMSSLLSVAKITSSYINRFWNISKRTSSQFHTAQF